MLYVVPTPLGDPEDLTLRALRVLREVRLIAAEDTRVTRELLRAHGVDPPRMLSCHDHNEAERAAEIAAAALEGPVALVSDAGTPLVNDPGWRVLAACRDAGVDIVVLPGPSAPITALVGSGLPVDRWSFGGFLPRDAGPRDAELARAGEASGTSIYFESPLRLADTLDAVARKLPTRRVCVARNLTKPFEQWIRGTAEECRAILGDETRGEVVLLIGPGDAPPTDAAIVDAAIDRLLAAGTPTKEARDAVAEAFGLPKREAYQRVLARSR